MDSTVSHEGTTIPIRVLIADDNPLVTEILAHHLTRLGWESIAVSDGEQVEMLLAKEHFDCLILDLHIPFRNGMEILEALKKNGNRHDLFIMMLTGQCREDTQGRAIALGADRFFSKPFDPYEIVGELQRSLSPIHQAQGRRS
ncbi:MAG TPA: response regulator [bacterium]|nr:response regulator [bacterium]